MREPHQAHLLSPSKPFHPNIKPVLSMCHALYEFCHSPRPQSQPEPTGLQFLTESSPTIVPTKRILPTIHEPSQYSHRQPMPSLCLWLYDLSPTPVP